MNTVPSWASGTALIARRELGALFDSAIGVAYFATFSVTASALFMHDFFQRGVIDMAPWFEPLPLLAAVFVPALTMRSWAEERRAQTHELLMTLPLRPSQLVVGKFLASWGMFVATLAGSLPIVAMLLVLGSPDLGLIAASYLGAALVGGLFVALGCLVSGLTNHQIIAFVVTSVVAGLLVLTGHDAVVATLDGLAPRLEAGTFLNDAVSVRPHFAAMIRGVVGAGDIAWFGGVTAALLGANLMSIGREPA
jgi:ABC-2 type transport system permease protein